MFLRRGWRRWLCGFAGLAAALAVAPAAAAASGALTLYVPSTENGGWDQTAIAMKGVLEAEGLAHDVAIVHTPGGCGGLVGLTQFVEARRGDPNALLVGGVGMIWSARANRSAITPLDTTPIARLTRDYYAVAVPAQSPLHSMGDLMAMLSSRPQALHWAGDQPAGAAQQMIWRIGEAAHVPPLSLPYDPRFGSGEVAAFLQQGDPDLVGAAGYGELGPALAGGGIRVLGVAADGTSFGGAPTLKGQGLDLVAFNWRSVFAPPGITPEQRQRLISMVTAMARSAMWREVIQRHNWDDCFLAGEDFAAFVADEKLRIFAIAPPERAPAEAARPAQSAAGAWLWPALAGLLAILLIAAVAQITLRARRAARRAAKVRATLAPLEAPPTAQSSPQQSPVAAAINCEFDAWKLSAAERDVAWFLLKGLSMKEIARLRNASERTVRQQARAVYGKAGLEGRTDLAAHILDQCLAPVAVAPAAGEA